MKLLLFQLEYVLLNKNKFVKYTVLKYFVFYTYKFYHNNTSIIIISSIDYISIFCYFGISINVCICDACRFVYAF